MDGEPAANLPAIAGLYSQLAGVVAGFAFAGVIALLAAQVTSGTFARRSLASTIPLIGAFVGLTASSLDYAIVAGEDRGTARVADLQSVAGVGFSVAGLLLFYSLLILFRGLQMDVPATTHISARAASLCRGIVGALVPILGGLLYGGLRDHLSYERGDSSISWPDITMIGAVALSAVGSLLIAYRTYRRPFSYVEGQRDPLALVQRVTILSVIIALGALIGTNVIIPGLEPQSLLPDWILVLLDVGFCIFATGVHWAAATYRT